MAAAMLFIAALFYSTAETLPANALSLVLMTAAAYLANQEEYND